MQAHIDLLKTAPAASVITPAFEALAKSSAEQFAAAAVETMRILPTEKANLTDQYFQAAIDDASSPLASGKKRTDFVAQSVANRKPHTLTTELINNLPADARVLNHALAPKAGAANEPTEEGMQVSEARRRKLLGMTEMGAEILADLAQHAK